jgi:hypothetical protein
MSTITDFTFNNPFIRDYFLGSDEYVPVPEFLYIHTHPLVKPNFMLEIEETINRTSEYLQMKNMKGTSVTKFLHLAQSLGAVLPIQDESKASEALKILREIYLFCIKITGKV